MNKAKHTLTREIECLLNDNHQKGKMMIMITKTSGSQVDSPVTEGKRKEGGGRKIAHNSAFQIPYQDSKRVSTIVIIVELSGGKRGWSFFFSCVTVMVPLHSAVTNFDFFENAQRLSKKKKLPCSKCSVVN